MESSFTSSNGSSSGGGSLPWEKAGPVLRIENPFTFKVGQVFTGFGVGCGLGIGVGRPLNLGAIPVLNQVMSAAGGATHAFSGIGRHVNQSLKKIGAKNIEAGIGCGVGFGHGFGVGLAVKPGVLHQIQTSLVHLMGNMMMKMGIAPSISMDQGMMPTFMQSGTTTTMLNQATPLNLMGNMMQHGRRTDNPSQALLGNVGNFTPQGANVKSSLGTTRTEKVLGNFLQSPVLREDAEMIDTDDEQLQSENRMLRMVLKHQQVIEELKEDNEKLHKILVEELKVSPEKLGTKSSSARSKNPCSDCFECRRRQRRR